MPAPSAPCVRKSTSSHSDVDVAASFTQNAAEKFAVTEPPGNGEPEKLMRLLAPSNAYAPRSFPVALNAGQPAPPQVPLFPSPEKSSKWEPLYSPTVWLFRCQSPTRPVVLSAPPSTAPLLAVKFGKAGEGISTEPFPAGPAHCSPLHAGSSQERTWRPSFAAPRV